MSKNLNDRAAPVTIPAELVQELWSEIKGLRDEAASQRANAQWREAQLTKLLQKMKDCGMAEWIPTIEEIRKAFREANEQEPE